nr:FMN-binding split barrel [Tanacetum cinerariifolium]
MASSKQTPSQSDEVLELINNHQEKAARLPPVEEVKMILVHTIRGMLSTCSKFQNDHPNTWLMHTKHSSITMESIIVSTG